MSNFGTSTIFNVLLQNMETLKYHKVTDFDMTVTHPPKIDVKNPTTTAIEKWTTPWPEISFEKVNYPKYEGIYQYLGEPSNQPDFIKDYHIISIARNIDNWAEPDFRAYIKANVNSVKSK